MKKIIMLLLALILTFSLVACGGNKTKETTKETAKETTAETKKETTKEPNTTTTTAVPKLSEFAGEKVELKYLLHAAGTNKEKIEEKVNARLKELGKNYSVKFIIFSWDSYDQKLGLAARGASADEKFDLATTASWLGPFKTLVAEKTLLPLDDLLKEVAPVLNESLTEAQKKGATIDGKLYGIQTVIDKAPMARDFFIWNSKQLEAIGKTEADVKDINTIQGLEPILKLYKEKFPEKYPMRTAKDTIWAERRVSNFIRTKADGSYEITNYLESPELKAKFEVIKKYVDAGYLDKEAGLQTTDEKQKDPETWLVGRAEGEPGSFADWEASDKVKVYTTPIADDFVIYNENIQGKLTSLYAHTQHPKEALNFVEVVKFDPVVQNLMAFGIEGDHYTLENGRVKVNEQTEWNPWNNQWSNDVRLPRVSGADINSPEMKAKIEEYTKVLVPSADLGFNPSVALQEKITEVLNRGKETLLDLQNGRMDGYEDYVKGLKEVGVDQVINDLKTEFETWKKSN